jgi:hypothetical protein
MPFLPYSEFLRITIRQTIEMQQMQMMFAARAMAMQGALRRRMLPERTPVAPATPAPAPRKARAAARPALAAE